jgi:hypothetical protein
MALHRDRIGLPEALAEALGPILVVHATVTRTRG